jgi:hypothetical protein
LAEVRLDVSGVDARDATLDGERADDLLVEEISQNRVGLSQKTLEGVEETGRLRNSARGQQGHHVRAERGEEIGITWRRARWERAPVRGPLAGERRERAAQGRFEVRWCHAGDGRAA